MENRLNPTGEGNDQKKEWYKKPLGIVIAILLFPYFFLWYMWAKTNWNKSVKWTITGILIFFTIRGIVNDSTIQPAQPSAQPQQQVVQKQPEQKRIPYEVVTKWNIPNGGYGQRIVIDSKYLNFDDMTALGETIKEDTKNDRNAFVFVHTDKKSAELQGKAMEITSEADLNYIGKHYVGDYKKNINSNFHQFSIFLKGVDDTSQETNKVITY